MTIVSSTRSRDIRAHLNHPVIDTDGHMVEVFSGPVRLFASGRGSGHVGAHMGQFPPSDRSQLV